MAQRVSAKLRKQSSTLRLAIVGVLVFSALLLVYAISRVVTSPLSPGLDTYSTDVTSTADTKLKPLRKDNDGATPIQHASGDPPRKDRQTDSSAAEVIRLRKQLGQMQAALKACEASSKRGSLRREPVENAWEERSAPHVPQAPVSGTQKQTAGGDLQQGAQPGAQPGQPAETNTQHHVPAVQPPPALPHTVSTGRDTLAVGPGPSPRLPVLVLGIPTIARQGAPDYLMRTLGYIAQQTTADSAGKDAGRADMGSMGDAPGPHKMRVRAVIINNSREKDAHTVFTAAVAKYCGPESEHVIVPDQKPLSAPAGSGVNNCFVLTVDGHRVFFRPNSLFTFALNQHDKIADGNDEGTPNVPGLRVRQQSRDVVDLLTLVHDLFGHAAPTGGVTAWSKIVTGSRAAQGLYPGLGDGVLTHFMTDHSDHFEGSDPLRMSLYSFMEDDFRLCPDGLSSLALLHARAQAEVGEWNAARWAFGLAGATIRAYDVPVFRDYLQQHLARRPPDHLFVEWFAGEKPQSAEMKAGRTHVAFRYNLLEHFGYSSSLRAAVSPVYAYCYDDLNEAVVFEVEAFKSAQCGHDLIWPCLQPGDPRLTDGSLPDGKHIDFEGRRANARVDTVQTWTL